MTAIGLVLVGVVFLFAALRDGGLRLPEGLQIALGFALIAGVALLIAGAATWLWRVMP